MTNTKIFNNAADMNKEFDEMIGGFRFADAETSSITGEVFAIAFAAIAKKAYDNHNLEDWEFAMRK